MEQDWESQINSNISLTKELRQFNGKTVFSTKVAGPIGNSHTKGINESLISCTIINSKYIIDTDVGAKTIKLSEKNYICVILGKAVNLFYLGLGNDFLDITPKAQW